jgi:hypothetical protein
MGLTALHSSRARPWALDFPGAFDVLMPSVLRFALPERQLLAEIHDFDDTVVAIVSDPEKAEAALAGLKAAGYDIEILEGEEGKEHLDPGGESGPIATVKRLLNAFGDQYRLLERLNAELDDGNLVISVEAEPDQADDAVRILQDYDGEFIWKLGTWTYTRVGE